MTSQQFSGILNVNFFLNLMYGCRVHWLTYSIVTMATVEWKIILFKLFNPKKKKLELTSFNIMILDTKEG